MKKWVNEFLEKHGFTVILILFLIMTICCLWLSYFFDVNKLSWYSNVMISIACGLISGLVIYFLSNIRSNRQKRINTDYQMLYQLLIEAKAILRDARYYKEYEFTWGEETSLSLRCEKLIMRFENYHEAVLSLPDRLFLQLGLDEENLFTDSSSSQIAELYQHIEDFDDHQCYITVYEKMISYMDSSIAVISPTMKKYTNLYRSSETTFL